MSHPLLPVSHPIPHPQSHSKTYEIDTHPRRSEREHPQRGVPSSGLRLSNTNIQHARSDKGSAVQEYETLGEQVHQRRARGEVRPDVAAIISPSRVEGLDGYHSQYPSHPFTATAQPPQVSYHGSSPYSHDSLAHWRQQSPPPHLPVPGPSSSASLPSPFGHYAPHSSYGFGPVDYRNLRSPHPPLSASVCAPQSHARAAGNIPPYGHPQYNASQSPYDPVVQSPLTIASTSRRSSLAEPVPPPHHHLSTSPLHLASLHPSIYQQQLYAGVSQPAQYPSAASPFVRSSPHHHDLRNNHLASAPHTSSSAAQPPPHLPPISSIYPGSTRGGRPSSSTSSITPAFHHFTSPPIPLQAPLPQPLRFAYTSPSPTGSTATIMPPRKKPNTASSALSVTNTTPGTQSSVGTGVSSVPRQGNGWKTEHIMTDNGKPQEVIVLDDSHSPAPPPIPKKRTRAQAALEAAQAQAQANGMNGSASASTSVAAGSAKKRKVGADDLASSVGSSASKKGKAKATGSTKGAGSAASQAAQYYPPYPAAAAPKPLPAAPAAAAAAAAPHAGPAWDDKEGHYIVKPDEMINGQFKIIRLLGQGTFGKVVECRDVLTRRKVAIKVIRAVQKYRDASKIEVRVLQALKQADPQNVYKCIHMDEYFDFRNHPCIVSELLGMSVFDFLKENKFQPFPDRHIQDFARSLLTSVSFLHRLKLVHTDLKPENILLAENGYYTVGPRAKASRTPEGPKSYHILKNTDIRLIDFGSATFENEYHSTVVSTRHYRAPEIILGLSWSYPCDMFSIGCILVEFFTGDALFQTHDNLEHLAMMEVVMGKMPARILKAGCAKKPEFFRGSVLDFPNAQTPKSSRKFVKGLQPLHKIITAGDATNNLFLDLVVRLLDFDPQRRITVDQALLHPYFKQQIPPPVAP